MQPLSAGEDSIECLVIGAGVVGLAVARALTRRGRGVLVVERGAVIGGETSSRNSEVIHAGIYYAPGSLKARLCRRGRDMLYDYCASRGVPHRQTGKILVATAAAEIPVLDRIKILAEANDVGDLHRLDAADIARMEPEVRAVAGLFSPRTGIIDSHAFMLSLRGEIEGAGGMIALEAPVIEGETSADCIRVLIGGAAPMTLRARQVINAAGLHAQEVAAALGTPPAAIPPRQLAIGHYYSLSGRAPFRHLIYPVPEDGGVGIHVTLDMGGAVRFGPDVRWIDRLDYAFDDDARDRFIAAIQRYYPGLDPKRLHPGYTGIRPKLVGAGGGFADFRIDGPEGHGLAGVVNLYGIESPGLTASLAIAEEIAARLDSA